MQGQFDVCVPEMKLNIFCYQGFIFNFLMIEWNFFLIIVFTNFFLISFQVFSDRMSKVQETQTNLLEEVKRESVKFGDDVKYLAEFTSGMKKFDPWIEKAEKKKEKGMPKPNNLEEANDALEDAKVCIYSICFNFTEIFFLLLNISHFLIVLTYIFMENMF